MDSRTEIRIDDATKSVFEEFDNDSPADVLRPWDCDAQDWIDGTTTVFRFESDDLFVQNVMGGLDAKRGAIDTQSVQLDLLEGVSDESCITWRSDPSFSDLIGRVALSATLIETFV